MSGLRSTPVRRRPDTPRPSLLRDQLARGRDWLSRRRRFVLATLVDVDGSAPFETGAFMLISEDGRIEGSLSGGCVESEVAAQALEMLEGRAAARLISYGIADALAQTAGLMCGGTVHVLLRSPGPADAAVLEPAFDGAARGRPVVVATLLDGPAAGATMALIDGDTVGSLRGGDLLDLNVEGDLGGALHRGGSSIRRYGAAGTVLGDDQRVHFHSYLPPPRLLIVGAIDHAAALASLATTLGYAVTITDARPAFAASERFARAADVIVGWPQEIVARQRLGPRDAALVLSHDPRFDGPALLALLDSECGYIGALGSRRTTAERRARLMTLGVGEPQLGRIHGPCGLDIGAATPEEVAVSILAEVIGSRTARNGRPLRDATGAIRGRSIET